MQSNQARFVIDINSEQINCSYFTIKKNKICLNSHLTFDLDNFQINQLAIYNFKHLTHILNSFLNLNNEKNSSVFLSLSGKPIIEKIDKASENKNFDTDKYINAGYKLNDTDVYQALVPHFLIFQYNLFFKFLNLRLSKITTLNLCKLNILSKYTNDLSQSNMDLSTINELYCQFIELISIDDLISYNKDIDFNNRKSLIFNNLGLFLLDD